MQMLRGGNFSPCNINEKEAYPVPGGKNPGSQKKEPLQDAHVKKEPLQDSQESVSAPKKRQPHG